MSTKTAALRSDDEAAAVMVDVDTVTRRRHLLLQRVAVSECIALFVLMIMVIIMVASPPPDRFFFTDGGTRIEERGDLLRPVNTLPEISYWLETVVSQAFSLNFAETEEAVANRNAAREAFTDAGWDGFQKALKDSGVLPAVNDNKYVTSAITTGAALLQKNTVVNGLKTYSFQIPLLVTYLSATTRSSQKMLVTAIVVSAPEKPRGIGITQILME